MGFSQNRIEKLEFETSKHIAVYNGLFVAYLLALTLSLLFSEFLGVIWSEWLVMSSALIGAFLFCIGKNRGVIRFFLKFLVFLLGIGIYSHFLRLTMIFLGKSNQDIGLASGPFFLMAFTSIIMATFGAWIAFKVSQRHPA